MNLSYPSDEDVPSTQVDYPETERNVPDSQIPPTTRSTENPTTLGMTYREFVAHLQSLCYTHQELRYLEDWFGHVALPTIVQTIASRLYVLEIRDRAVKLYLQGYWSKNEVEFVSNEGPRTCKIVA